MANRTVAVQLKAEIGQYVAGMSKASAATMRLGESAKASQASANKSFDLAGKGALVMGGAIVAGLGLAVNKSMEFEKALSGVQAATGATAGTMSDLRDAAMKAGADTKYSATEAADAITEMAKAGVSAKDIMGGGLSGALALAAAGQIDVAEAAGIASTAMTQFSLTGKDLPHVADLLAAGAGKAMGSVDDLGMALNQAGLVASASGLSIEETTGTLAAFASAGLLGSDAGTSMKTMLQKLQAPSKEAAGVMSELGINMYDANGNMLGMAEMAGQLKTHMSGLTQEQRNSALATIFGSDAVRAATVLYTQGAQGIADWTAKVNDSGYAARQAAALQDNLSGDLEKLGGAFDTLMISLGSGAQGPLREIVQLLTSLMDGIGMVVGAFNSLPGPVSAALIVFGLLAAFKGPLSGMFETVGLKALYMKDGIVGAVTSTTGLKSAMSSIAGAFTPMTIGITSATILLPPLIDLVKNLTGNSDSAAAGQKALADALRATNGVIDESARKAAQQQIISEGLVDVLHKAGVSGRDAIDGLLGNADAQGRVNSALQDYITTTMHAQGPVNTNSAAVSDAQTKYRQLAEALGMSKEEAEFFADAATGAAGATTAAGNAAEGTVAQSEAATKALEDWLKQVAQIGQAFIDPLATYQGLLQTKQAAEQASAQATADSTTSSKDSWKDYVKDVTVSLGEYATKLEEQLTAQENWRANIVTVTQRGGLEIGQILLGMGEQGAGITAQMATATAGDFERMKTDLIREAQGATAGLDSEMKVMAAVGTGGSKATVQGIAAQLQIGADAVRAIAAKYGINLAEGINPILHALGVPAVHGPAQSSGGYADGGYTGDGPKYTPAGIVHKGEFVFPQEAVSRIGVGNLGAMAGLPGYASGGFVSAASVPKPYSTAPYGSPISTAGDATMGKEYDEVRAWVDKSMGAMGGGGPAGAGVQRWLPLVLASLNMVGQPAGLAQTVLRRMQQESGGNPRAINLTDINAQRGTPSKGLMQVIDPTFRAYAMPGHASDIWDPLSNLLASERYAMARYGSLSAAYNKAGGYDQGGLAMGAGYLAKATVSPERVLSPRQTAAFEQWMSREVSGANGGGSSAGSAVSVNITGAQIVGTLDLGDGIRGVVRGEIIAATQKVALSAAAGSSSAIR